MLEMESDSQYLVQLLTNYDMQPAIRVRYLVDEIRRMLVKFRNVKIHWKSREANSVADQLAKKAAEIASNKEWWRNYIPKFINAPSQLKEMLEENCSFWYHQYPSYIYDVIRLDEYGLGTVRCT